MKTIFSLILQLFVFILLLAIFGEIVIFIYIGSFMLGVVIAIIHSVYVGIKKHNKNL
jgi:hypothetical protein